MKANTSAAGSSVGVGVGMAMGLAPGKTPSQREPAPLPTPTRLSGRPGIWLGEIVAGRDLLAMLVWRELKVKYKQSVMGFLWAILMPALIVSAGVIVKYAFASLSGKPLEASDVI